MLREYLGHNQEARPFAQRIKQLTKEWFPHAQEIVDYGDPAVVQKKDTGSTLGDLASEGITMMYQTSTIDRGLRVCRAKLTQLIDGEPAAQFSRNGVPILISALRGGYRLDDKGLKPVKDGYYDHEADAWRYGGINLFDSSGSTISTQNLPTSISPYDAQEQ